MLEAVQHGYNVGGLFVWNVGEDDKNSSRHVLQVTAERGHVYLLLHRADTELLQVDQGGLTLTTRDQYINKTVEEDPVLGALLQVLYCTVLYCAVLYCAVLCCTVPACRTW